jgi:hypothetical protein
MGSARSKRLALLKAYTRAKHQLHVAIRDSADTSFKVR